MDTLLLNVNQKKKKKHRLGSSELVKLGVDSTVLRSLDRPRLRDCRIHNSSNANVDANSSNLKKRKRNLENCEKVLSDSPTTKRWIRSVHVFGFTSYCFFPILEAILNLNLNLKIWSNWIRLSFDNVQPKAFIGLQCKASSL